MSDTLLINNILNAASERKATDVHLIAGSNPVIRVDGRLVTLTKEQVLTPDHLLNIANLFLSKEDLDRLSKEKEIVTIYNWANRSRFRAKVFYQKGYLAISLRLIPAFIRSPKDLGVPSVITQLLSKDKGLIIVAGPYGSGRSATVAGLLETLNQNKGVHIQTLENPIEYLFSNNQSIVEQRQVGRDTASFIKVLRDIFDEDVDVVCVSSMQEEGIQEVVLELAESGKLMIVVMDTDSVISTLEEFIVNLSASKRDWGQSLLSEVLLGILVQRLLPRIGGGLTLATEVLTMTSAVGASIKEDRLYQLNSIMQTSRDEGMMNLDKSLEELVNVGEITSEDASKYALVTKAFKQNYR